MKWISVKDRLPNHDEDVLVILDNRASNVFSGFFYYGKFVYFNNGFTYHSPTESDRIPMCSMVTHWISAPEWEEDDDE